MAMLQYKSLDEINRSPADLLDFAQNLKTLAESYNGPKMPFQSLLQKEVEVDGKPFMMARHLYDLSRREFDMDDMKPEQVMQLHKAGSILRKLEPRWDIAPHMDDPRLSDKLEEMKSLAPVEDMAKRVGQSLGGLGMRPPEHTVRTGVLRL